MNQPMALPALFSKKKQSYRFFPSVSYFRIHPFDQGWSRLDQCECSVKFNMVGKRSQIFSQIKAKNVSLASQTRHFSTQRCGKKPVLNAVKELSDHPSLGI
jgi:hypothetical protein